MNDDFSNLSKISELTTQLLLATNELVFQNEGHGFDAQPLAAEFSGPVDPGKASCMASSPGRPR